MNRVLVAFLSAVDAVVAVVVGLAAAFAPLAVLWAFGLGSTASWAALWPTGATLWQLGNLVPMQIDLPAEYLAVAGIEATAGSFALSLAPLAFASFTAIFALRSGARAARAAAWVTGVLTGGVVFGVLTAAVWLLGANPIARPDAIAAIAIPTALYLSFALAGALIAAWREGDDGLVDRIHDAAAEASDAWEAVPGLVVRGSVIVLVGLIGAGAILLGGAVLWNAGEIIALYEAGHATALGGAMLTLGQLAYLPTVVVWTLSWLCGPGFSLGTATAVSPAGTQLGVVPGVPILGVVPESASPWLLLVLLVPVGIAVLAGTILRGPFSSDAHTGPRVVAVLSISVLTALGAAGLAGVASGSFGPGRLADLGPAPGPLALAVGVEVLVGVCLGLFSPAPRRRRRGGFASPGDSETTAPTTAFDSWVGVMAPPSDTVWTADAGPEEDASEVSAAGPARDAVVPDERSRPTALPPVD